MNFQLEIPPGGLDQEEAARSSTLGEDDSTPDDEDTDMSEAQDDTGEAKEATVVSLDAFRKK